LRLHSGPSYPGGRHLTAANGDNQGQLPLCFYRPLGV